MQQRFGDAQAAFGNAQTAGAGGARNRLALVGQVQRCLAESATESATCAQAVRGMAALEGATELTASLRVQRCRLATAQDLDTAVQDCEADLAHVSADDALEINRLIAEHASANAADEVALAEAQAEAQRFSEARSALDRCVEVLRSGGSASDIRTCAALAKDSENDVRLKGARGELRQALDVAWIRRCRDGVQSLDATTARAACEEGLQAASYQVTRTTINRHLGELDKAAQNLADGPADAPTDVEVDVERRGFPLPQQHRL